MTQSGKSLREHLRFLLKDSVIYGLGGALNKVITLFTFPLLARHFSVQDFGTVDLLNTVVVLAVTILVFGQDSAVARYFYEQDDTTARQQVVSQSFALQAGLLAVAVPILLLASAPLANLLNLGADGSRIIQLMVLQLPFFVLVNFSQGLLKWTFKRREFLVISVGTTAATLAGVLLAIAWGKLSLLGIFAIYLVVRTGFGLLGLWYVRYWLVWPRNLIQLRGMMPYAVPFGVISVAASLLPFVERGAVAGLVGRESLGIYAAGAKVATLIAFVTTAFETSWGPFALSIFRQPAAERTFRAVLMLATLILCGASLALAAVGDLVVVVLGSARYAGAGCVVFALAMGVVAQTLGGITEVGILFAQRSYLKLYAYGLGLLVTAVAIYLLSARFGIVGVAWGSLAGYVSKTVFEAFLAQQVHSIRWHYGPPLVIYGLTLGTGLLYQLTFDTAVVLGVRWVPLAGFVCILTLAWWGLLSRDERKRLVGWMRKGVAP